MRPARRTRGGEAPSRVLSIDRLHLGRDHAPAMIATHRRLHPVAAAKPELPDEMRRDEGVAGSWQVTLRSTSHETAVTRRIEPALGFAFGDDDGRDGALPACSGRGPRPRPRRPRRPFWRSGRVRLDAAGASREVAQAARRWRRQVLTRRSRRRGLWDVGARGAIVCRTAVAFRGEDMSSRYGFTSMSLASRVGRGCAGRGPRPRRGGRLRSFMQPSVSW